ncbi:hypothetical protein [Pseudomonas sp. Sample_22]|uniref:hypothetical protein n=1 Tax=Pseudomonas sp. Sample_22 TaxID=2448266 RepID=UPI0015A95390|nr:hypothetical protein [Pseudomonas sp. Sample_22]
MFGISIPPRQGVRNKKARQKAGLSVLGLSHPEGWTGSAFLSLPLRLSLLMELSVGFPLALGLSFRISLLKQLDIALGLFAGRIRIANGLPADEHLIEFLARFGATTFIDVVLRHTIPIRDDKVPLYQRQERKSPCKWTPCIGARSFPLSAKDLPNIDAPMHRSR